MADFDALAAHRYRAATVAVLLECCDERGLDDGMLANAAGIIGEELRAMRECAERIQKAVMG